MPKLSTKCGKSARNNEGGGNVEKQKPIMKATPELWADHSFRMYAEAYEQGLVELGNEGFHEAQAWWEIYNSTKEAPKEVKDGRPVFDDHAGEENEDRNDDLPNRYPILASLISFLLGVAAVHFVGL